MQYEYKIIGRVAAAIAILREDVLMLDAREGKVSTRGRADAFVEI